LWPRSPEIGTILYRLHFSGGRVAAGVSESFLSGRKQQADIGNKDVSKGVGMVREFPRESLVLETRGRSDYPIRGQN